MLYGLLFVALFLAGCSNESSPGDAAATPPPLFLQAESAETHSLKPDEPGAAAEQTVTLNADITRLQPGERFVFQEPAGTPRTVEIVDRTVGQDGGITLKGRLKTDAGDYRLHAIIGSTGTFGRIQTPTTTFQITVRDGKTVLIDLYGLGNVLVPKSENDMAIPPRPPHSDSRQDDLILVGSGPTAVEALPQVAGRTTIDVMILYTPGLAAAYPGDLLANRLDYLVSAANAAYSNSGIDIYLRLVHHEQIDYPDSTANGDALSLITAGSAPFGGVEALRQLHGADLVALVRPFDYETHGGCGIAWLNGSNGHFTGFDAAHGYSIVSDGSEKVGVYTYYCSDLSFTHELGHNMGSTHDRANAGSGIPVYSYAYGYGISGSFGTIMSYISPETDNFSNPALSCGPQNAPCGVDENAGNAAHNTLSLNNVATGVAAFVSSQYSGDIDEDGQVTLMDSIKALQIASGQSPAGTINKLEDINGDGTIGLEETIYILQQQD